MRRKVIILILLIFPVLVFSQGVKINSNVVVSEETILYIDGNLEVDSHEIRVESGSKILMGNQKTLTVNEGGSIRLMGTPSDKVTVSSPGYFVFIVKEGGEVGAQHAIFEKMSGNGLNIQNGAYIDTDFPLHNCTFRNGVEGSTLLTINNNQYLTISGAAFIAGGSELINVSKTLNHGEITFTAYSGAFAGASFEMDPYGRIHWLEIPENLLIEGLTVNNGMELCLDALDTIFVKDLLINTGGELRLVAGHKIIFIPGIVVTSGGYMHAWISTDNIFCNNISILAANDEDDKPDLDAQFISVENTRIKLFPNPTTGLFTIEVDAEITDNQIAVELYNVIGECLVRTIVPDATHLSFDISDRQNGLYIIRLSRANDVHTIKIVKQ